MRKLTGAAFISLDGVMQGPGGPNEDRSGGFSHGGWVAPYWAESPFDEVIGSDYDLLLGKRTYDIFAAYWPHNREMEIGETFQRINKYVLTHSDEPLEWENSHRIAGVSTAVAVADLKKTEGRDLLIQGSSTLYPPLLSAGLIDRLILMTFPIVLGAGKRIWGEATDANALKLVDSSVMSTGVLYSVYEPGGEVQTGTFETKPPSEAELKRRKQWAKEEA